MTITVNIGNATANNLAKLFYDNYLNDIREAEIYTDGNDPTLQAEYDTEKAVQIYRNGTLVFEGEVVEKQNTQGGGIVLFAIGQEEELTETEAPVTGSTHSRVWTSTSDNTIFNDIVTTASGWSTDTTGSTSVTLDSFKTTDSMSVWNAMQKFRKTTNKDFYIDDASKTVYLVDSKNRTGKAAFNEGQNCGGITYKKSKSKASKVIVYGKGDGDNQIIGSHGSGTPVKRITDRAIITEAEANTRAEKEYDLINNSIFHYNFRAYNPNEDVETGDTIKINAPTANLDDQSADIVRIRRGLINDKETLSIQVTDTNHRIAKANRAKIISEIKQNYEVSQSAMQGSGNTLNWSRGINAKSGAPLRLPFYIPSDFIEDEAGNLRVDSMTLDYDIDPYKRGVGTASETGVAPSLTAGKTDLHQHDPSDSGHPHNNPTQTSNTNTDAISEGSSSEASQSLSIGWNTGITSVSVTRSSVSTLFVKLLVYMNSGGPEDLTLRIQMGSTDHVLHKINLNNTGAHLMTYMIPLFQSLSSANVNLDIYASGSCNVDVDMYVYSMIEDHSHDITSWDTEDGTASVSDDDKDPNLVGDAENHDHSVSIGDDVSDAGSVNASEVDIYLDYWNGSSWVNKHSILNTGKTLDEDVDITDSGTYPDAAGYWRVRVEPDNASADYAQAIVKIKHALDN